MIKIMLAVLVAITPVLGFTAVKKPDPVQVKADPSQELVKIDLDSVAVAQVLRIAFGEVMRTPYVLSPAVLADVRPVSFRWSDKAANLRPFLNAFVSELGFHIDTRAGVDFVVSKPEKKELSIAADEQRKPFVYRVKYRDSSYLSELVRPVFGGTLSTIRGLDPGAQNLQPVGINPVGKQAGTDPQSKTALQLIDKGADVLVFSGTDKELALLQSLLPLLDVPESEVTIRGHLYEVQSAKKDGSAFGLFSSILGNQVELGRGVVGAAGSLDTFLRVKSATLEMVVSALSSDSRFTVVSSPVIRAKSGSAARLNVGQSVPVLGAVSYQQGSGQPVQSVEYRDSGVIFSVTPTVRENSVDLVVNQEVSDFVATTTGVTTSPTLTKKALSTSLTVKDSELVVIGGLSTGSDSSARAGLSFLPDWMGSKISDKSNGELLLVLSVTR